MATPPPVCVCVCVCVCAWATGAVSQIAGGGHTSSGPVPAFTNGDCVSARFSTVTALTFGPTPAGYGGDSVVTVYAAEPNSNILRSITVNAGGSGRYLPPPHPPPPHTHTNSSPLVWLGCACLVAPCAWVHEWRVCVDCGHWVGQGPCRVPLGRPCELVGCLGQGDTSRSDHTPLRPEPPLDSPHETSSHR